MKLLDYYLLGEFMASQCFLAFYDIRLQLRNSAHRLVKQNNNSIFRYFSSCGSYNILYFQAVIFAFLHFGWQFLNGKYVPE